MIKNNIDQAQKPGRYFFYGYIIVGIIFIIQIIMFGGFSTSGVFFKPLINEFGWSRALLSGAFSFSRMAQGLSGIVMGGLNDRLGPRVVITICGILVGAGFLMMFVTDSVWQLYLFYVVILGTGMGGVYAPQMSTIAKWFTKRRNLMTGIAFAGGSLGGLFLPPVVNSLISNIGWRGTYIVLGTFALISMIVGAQFLRRDPSHMGQVPFGERKLSESREHSPVKMVEGFSLKEALYTQQFWLLIIMSFCNIFCLMTIMVHIVPHATDLGISAPEAAVVLGVLSGGLLTGSLIAGLGADRIGTRRTFIICFVPMVAVLLLLLPVTNAWMIGLIVFVMAFGNGGAATLMSSMFAELFGMRSHGLILGFSNLLSTFGAAIGPFIAGLLFDTRGSYQLAFFLCGVLVIIALAVGILLKPVTKQVRHSQPLS
jgi:MFS family permease